MGARSTPAPLGHADACPTLFVCFPPSLQPAPAVLELQKLQERISALERQGPVSGMSYALPACKDSVSLIVLHRRRQLRSNCGVANVFFERVTAAHTCVHDLQVHVAAAAAAAAAAATEAVQAKEELILAAVHHMFAEQATQRAANEARAAIAAEGIVRQPSFDEVRV